MNKRIMQAVLVGALCISSNVASAIGFGAVGYMNGGGSGEDFMDVTKKSDTSSETSTVGAGGVIHFAAGLVMRDYLMSSVGSFETVLSYGFQGDSVSAQNGTVGFYRKPIEALQFYNFNLHQKDGAISPFKIRVGGGMTFDKKVEAKCDVDLSCATHWYFEDAQGYVGQVDFVVRAKEASPKSRVNSYFVGVRYKKIEYVLDATSPVLPKSGARTIDGSHFAVSLGVAF